MDPIRTHISHWPSVTPCLLGTHRTKCVFLEPIIMSPWPSSEGTGLYGPSTTPVVSGEPVWTRLFCGPHVKIHMSMGSVMNTLIMTPYVSGKPIWTRLNLWTPCKIRVLRPHNEHINIISPYISGEHIWTHLSLWTPCKNTRVCGLHNEHINYEFICLWGTYMNTSASVDPM